MNGVLYRTAKDEKDYRGGNNNFCSIFKLVDCVNNLFDRMEVPETVNESKQITEKLYSWDEIQDMVSACHKDAKLKKKVLSKLTTAGPLGKKDKADTEYVIDCGDADYFERFDSAVTDNFITAYLIATGAELNESEEMSYTMYKGYDISYNFYGRGEYTVQYCGDDVLFHSEDDAKAFIDRIVAGELDEATIIDEEKDFEGEVELDYLIAFNDRLDQDEFKAIAEYLSEYIGGKKPALKTGKIDWEYGSGDGDFVGFNDSAFSLEIDDDDQTIEIYGFMPYSVPAGEDGSDGDGLDDAVYQEILKSIILSAPAASDLTKQDIKVRTLSEPVDRQYYRNWDSYVSRLAYDEYLSGPDPDRKWKEMHGESIDLTGAINQILEGKSLKTVVENLLS